jgi:type IV pilus assembly protein PilA
MLDRKGFTLIELLIVVVIIGILAAIAIPKFSNTREKAYIASMKSDLRNLATAQESYFADNVATGYTNSLTALGAGQSQGVTIAIANQSGTGWTATAAHTASTKTCSIYFGTIVQGPATTEGEVRCTT